MLRFAEKVVVVTGAASGIGQATAIKFAAEGATVAIVDLQEEAGLQTAALIQSNGGGKAAFYKADVSDDLQVEVLMRGIIEDYGTVHVLVNNAAMLMTKTVENTTSAEWDRIFRVNTKSVFLCSKYALPELKKNNGRIVNMASLNGQIGQKGNTAYAASKGAIIAMTKAMAVDYAHCGVRINCVCPAGVATPLLDQWFASMDDPLKGRADQERSHLLGYIASPQEIADTILFLASKQSGFITGQSICVDGGASLGYGAGPKAEWDSTSL
jgi:NAD(P)-dependent dehydrogenase (short-subunit alcohol dehydrogenase family)